MNIVNSRESEVRRGATPLKKTTILLKQGVEVVHHPIDAIGFNKILKELSLFS
ncbi:MAG: hypothetical protein GXO97_01560, partial [Nitrospirae bacterium]|nr:hypothetical protein [Nitrospirota bacterium]